MAKIFKFALALGLRRNRLEEQSQPIPLAADVVDFDPATNPTVIPAFEQGRCDVAGGVLLIDGVPFPVLPDGPDESRRKFARQLIPVLEAGTATNAQVQRALAFALRFIFSTRVD